MCSLVQPPPPPADVSEERTAPIFRVKELDKQAVLPSMFACWANSVIMKVGEVLSKRR
jgi:hypothetical protein